MSEEISSRPGRQRIIRFGARSGEPRKRHFLIPLHLVFGLMLIIAIGTVLLKIPGVATRPLSNMEALFTSTSASAVTGLSLFSVSTDLTIWGQVVLLVLVQIGGVGLIVAVVSVFRMLGRQVRLGERLAVASSLGLDRTEDITLVMARAMVLMLAIEGVGALLLYLNWRLSGIVPAGKAGFYAIFHAVTAYCNAGP